MVELLPCRDPTQEQSKLVQQKHKCQERGVKLSVVKHFPVFFPHNLLILVNNVTSSTSIQGFYTILSVSQYTLQDCGNMTHELPADATWFHISHVVFKAQRQTHPNLPRRVILWKSHVSYLSLHIKAENKVLLTLIFTL